tara:strand:- start:295 stop:1374 length:1080 start_codon:yes stop_codon:yes gene_type:complete
MKKVLLCAAFIASSFTSIAQVGVGTITPDASAALEVKSTTSGLLPPRMTTAERDVINSGIWAEGLTIYNTDNKCLELYNGTNWISVCDGSVVTTSPFGIIPNNATCTSAAISATPCATVTGATLNDDGGTADGIEYDWTGATGNMTGGTTQALVEIGGQCWFRRNSVAAPTAPISALPNDSPNIWVNTTVNDEGYWGYYNTAATDGTTGWSTIEPVNGEGLLYQWSAAMNNSTTERAQGVCPTNWHIPSDCEWMYLENSLGMTTADQQLTGFRDSGTVGSKLSTLSSSGNNSSGFTALLAGYRYTNGTFYNRGTIGYWWSSSETSAAIALYRSLISGLTGLRRNSLSKAFGFSVRCLKD